jgi:hypothetical protein
MWNFKVCPRCGGDTYIDKYIGQFYETCLQCGYEREMEKIYLKEQRPVKEDKAASIR